MIILNGSAVLPMPRVEGFILDVTYPVAISCKGVYYYRSGSTMQTLSGPELESFILRKRGASWDNMPLTGFTIDDIDDALVQKFKTLAAKKGRIDESVLSESKADLMEKLHLTNAGHRNTQFILAIL